MEFKKLTAKQKKRIIRIWVGEMLTQLDGGFSGDDVGVREDEIQEIVEGVHEIGQKYEEPSAPKMGALKDIVEYVRNTTK